MCYVPSAGYPSSSIYRVCLALCSVCLSLGRYTRIWIEKVRFAISVLTHYSLKQYLSGSAFIPRKVISQIRMLLAICFALLPLSPRLEESIVLLAIYACLIVAMIVVETAVCVFRSFQHTQTDLGSTSRQSKIGSAPAVEAASRSNSQNSLKDSVSEISDGKEP